MIWWKLTRWFDRDWWGYLLAPHDLEWREWPRVFICRVRGHPYPVVWFTMYQLEPDMHCTNCGDDLG